MWFDAVEYFTKYNKIISEYHKMLENGILLDTTPLLILFLGKFDKDNRTKLLEKFSIKEASIERRLNSDDFELLIKFINGLKYFGFFITPHIFTETIKHIWGETSKEQFQTITKYLLNEYSFLQEFPVCYKEISKNELFQNKKLEIGDISLMIENNKKSKTVISTDMQLIQIFEDKGFLVIPFQFLTSAKNTIPNI